MVTAETGKHENGYWNGCTYVL